MTDYIERETLLNSLNEAGIPYDADINSLIKKAPAVNVAPVRHGWWIEQEDPAFDTFYTCSVCKDDFYIETVGESAKDLFLYTYCPSCGAKMDGSAENEESERIDE